MEAPPGWKKESHMPKLQVALDMIALEDVFPLVKQLELAVDILEAGTPFLLKYGLKAVHDLKKAFPSVEILCDGKIMDAGAYEAESMFMAGADWVTVMAVTDHATIEECVWAAAKVGGKVMADMLSVTDVTGKVSFLEKTGVDCIAVHTGVDQQRRGRTALDELCHLKRYVTKSKIAVAGGITAETIDAYLALKPDIVIVGGGILAQANPARAAMAIRERMRGFAL